MFKKIAITTVAAAVMLASTGLAFANSHHNNGNNTNVKFNGNIAVNTATVDNTVTSKANTGDNTVVSKSITNGGDSNTSGDANAKTGSSNGGNGKNGGTGGSTTGSSTDGSGNVKTDGSTTTGAVSNATLTTGDANSKVTVVNVVNTNIQKN